MDLVRSACAERIYPVGNLDKDTTGLLLFTNDGEMAKRLTAPKNDYAKLYHVELTEKISQKDLAQLLDGVSLEDGFVKAEQVAFVDADTDRKQVGIRINSAKNRVVQRMPDVKCSRNVWWRNRDAVRWPAGTQIWLRVKTPCLQPSLINVGFRRMRLVPR